MSQEKPVDTYSVDWNLMVEIVIFLSRKSGHGYGAGLLPICES